MSNLISTFQIRFDDETKAEISELKNKLDEVNKSLNARDGGFWLESKKNRTSRIGQIVADAISNQIKEILRPEGLLKEMPPPDGLLKAMQAEAANDSNGVAPIHYEAQLHGGWVRHFDVDLLKPTINRETVNDVDYLSGSDLDECVPHIDDVLDQPNWLSESVPQITQADMQLIFIKNLSETLIQRMHSMDRFSDDDYAIGGNKLMAWDVLIYEPLDAYAVLMRGPGQINVADLLLIRDGGPMADAGWNTTSEAFATLRTITEAELPAFRAALEACYA